MADTTDVSIVVQSVDIAFAVGTTVDAAIDAPIVEVEVLSPTVDIQVGGSVPGATGPQGPPGPAGGSVVTHPAGQTLSTGRAVIIENGDAFYFQHTDPTHHGRCYGITITSASSIGADVDIQVGGVRADAAFTFVANNVLWVGANGVISDTLPVGGVIVQKAGISGEDRTMLMDFSVSTKINA